MLVWYNKVDWNANIEAQLMNSMFMQFQNPGQTGLEYTLEVRRESILDDSLMKLVQV